MVSLGTALTAVFSHLDPNQLVTNFITAASRGDEGDSTSGSCKNFIASAKQQLYREKILGAPRSTGHLYNAACFVFALSTPSFELN